MRGRGWRIGSIFVLIPVTIIWIVSGIGSPARADPDEKRPEFVLDEPLPPHAEPPVDRILVLKAERRLILLAGMESVADYGIALGSAPVGLKRMRGDGRTPEGLYRIDARKRDSDFHRALHISYPNAEDLRRARKSGVDPGGSIMIHGLPNGLGLIGSGHRMVDWTDGCIAVTNEEMDEIWDRVEEGVLVEIRP
ncbi:MAG TPA: hypothetical protein ENI85_19025 [Deltaproteobacteria bacterium]|nr:hypothetical protein [Deltaproteobacteria bacterium]